MIFKELEIYNFRSFEKVTLDLTNRNIIFGLNDIGKTNLLAALRFLLDGKFRNNGLVDSDFFNKDISKELSISVKIDISNEESEDSKKIYTMMRGAISSEAREIYIQLKSTYDTDSLIGRPNLFWGVDNNNLEAIPSNQSFFELDKFFNVIYIDSSIKLEDVFKKYSRELFRKEGSISDYEKEELNNRINHLNESIGELKTIKSFESDLISEYKKFKDDKKFKVSIRSEIRVENMHEKLRAYILDDRLENYPTSGDGRKKILAYTLFTLENRRLEDKKINIFLIEELENHLHRSMQIALSYQIFKDDIFKYLFMTTHSSLLISQMDNVNLIKLFKGSGVNGKSYIYNVPKEYENLKQKLNQNLAEAVFADVVLLVEGPSEKILFERVLKQKSERYESFGGYILEVDGINFIEYYKVLTGLGIKLIVKTDNDLKKVPSKNKCILLGVNRCRKLINLNNKNHLSIDPSLYDSSSSYVIERKKFIYDKLPVTIAKLRRENIYLSKVDLENDLYEVIPSDMDNLAVTNGSKKHGIDYLQSAKLINMIELTQILSEDSIEAIFHNENFECVKKMVNLCSR